MKNNLLTWVLVFIFSFNAIDNYLAVSTSDLFEKQDVATEQCEDFMADADHVNVHHLDYVYLNEKSNTTLNVNSCFFAAHRPIISRLLFSYSKIWQPPEII